MSTGNGDDLIDAKITAIKDKLKAVNDYVIENCGNPSAVFISAQFEIISRDIKALKINVDDFNSSLVYNAKCDSSPPCTEKFPTRLFSDCRCVCTVRCNATADFVTIRDKCECLYFDGYSEFIAARQEIQKAITELSFIFYDAETVNKLLRELNVELTGFNSAIGGFENRWNTTTEIQKITLIETTITKSKIAIEKSKTYITSGTCKTLCARPRVNKIPSCVCYTSKPISDFFRKFSIFAAIESRIRGYNFRLDSVNQKYFNDWALRIREEAAAFYKKVTESVYDVASQTILFNAFAKKVDDLDAAWRAYTAGLVVTTTLCSVSCNGDTVKNCAKCACLPVEGWTELNTNVANGIDGILAEIAGLTVDAADRATLVRNANKIKTGIAELKTYVTDFCGNLDENYVILRCLELLGWNAKLKSDIAAIKNPQFVEFCTTTCPNSVWVYDAAACKCTCNIRDCVVGSQTFDPYNCICAKNSPCTLTTNSCTGLTPLLDYSNCVCKKNPSPA